MQTVRRVLQGLRRRRARSEADEAEREGEMTDEFAVTFMAIKGEEEYVPSTGILAEVTDVEGDVVEIGFNAPIPGKPRMYLRVQLSEVVRRAVLFHQEKK